MTEINPQEKIYLTYKTRMTTEARLRKTALTSHVLLSWYSACLIILSVIEISSDFVVENSSMISAGVSLVTFALSLFIYGERYSERADQFKGCYLKLQRLYESQMDAGEKMREYSDILENYENQSDNDYDNMLFDAFLRGQSLSNARGPVRVSVPTFIRILVWRLFIAALVIALFIAPIVAGFLWVRPAASP
jgi:hypothetical protein